MTKLESYMSAAISFATQFYADVEGHTDDSSWCSRSRSLPSSPRNYILGVYPAHPFRDTSRRERLSGVSWRRIRRAGGVSSSPP